MEKGYSKVLAFFVIQSTQLKIPEVMTLPAPHPPPYGLQKKKKKK